MTTDSPHLNYTQAMQEFLREMAWCDALAFGHEERYVYLQTQVAIYGASIKMFLEAYDTDIVSIYLYVNHIPCKRSRIEEMRLLFSMINSTVSFGALQLIDRTVGVTLRWRHVVDFEGCNPTGTTLARNVTAGFSILAEFLEPIAAVALTRQTAADAMTEHELMKGRDDAEPN